MSPQIFNLTRQTASDRVNGALESDTETNSFAFHYLCRDIVSHIQCQVRCLSPHSNLSLRRLEMQRYWIVPFCSKSLIIRRFVIKLFIGLFFGVYLLWDRSTIPNAFCTPTTRDFFWLKSVPQLHVSPWAPRQHQSNETYWNMLGFQRTEHNERLFSGLALCKSISGSLGISLEVVRV